MKKHPGQKRQPPFPPPFLFCESSCTSLFFKLCQKSINLTRSIQWLFKKKKKNQLILSLSDSRKLQTRSERYPVIHITWRSPWLQATTCCTERPSAAPGESYSFTLTLLLFYGASLGNISAGLQTGEISHFQFIFSYQPFVSGGERAITSCVKTQKYVW